MSFVAKFKQNIPKILTTSVGVFVLLFAALLFFDNYFTKAHWVNTFGTVTSYTRHKTFRPRIGGHRYETKIAYVVNGITYYQVIDDDTTEPTIGMSVPLSYNPDNPRESGLQHEGQYVIAGILFGFGLLITIVGILIRYDPAQHARPTKKRPISKKPKTELAITATLTIIILTILFMSGYFS